MKVKKRVRTFGMMMVIFLTYIIFQRPDIASAADGNAAATTEIWLDSTHSIIVDYSIDVTYNYDEGYTGWIEDMEMRDGFGVGSNTVNIEQLYQSESFYTSGSSGYLVYFIDAHERWNNYTVYLTFRVTCDEWGELSWGVSYRSNS